MAKVWPAVRREGYNVTKRCWRTHSRAASGARVDANELSWDAARALVTIDTARAQSVVGFVGHRTLSIQDAESPWPRR